MEIEDIRKQRQPKGKSFWYYPAIFWKWLKKNKWKILITAIIAILLISPSWAGTTIGTWITDFIGNLVNSISI